MAGSPRLASGSEAHPDIIMPDDISLTSTIESQHDSEFEFEVEEIHAEDVDPADPSNFRYLIEWTGYHMDRWTWEPAHHVGDTALKEWQEKKARHRLGASQPFNVADFDAAVEEAERQRFERHRARNFRRKREGIPMVLYPGETETEYLGTINATDEDQDMTDFNDVLPPPKPVKPLNAHETLDEAALPKTREKVPEPSPRSPEVAKSKARPSLPDKPPSKHKSTATTGYQGTARGSSTTLPGKTRPITKAVEPANDKDAASTAPTQKAKKSAKKPQARSNSGNVFITGKQSRARKNLGDVMHDTSKQPKQFANMRVLNKASKYSHAAADRPPPNPHLLGLKALTSIGDAAGSDNPVEPANNARSPQAKSRPEGITAANVEGKCTTSDAYRRDSAFSEMSGQPLPKKSTLRKTGDGSQDQLPSKTRSVRFTGDEPGAQSPLVTTRVLEDVVMVDEPEVIVIDDDDDDDEGELFVGPLPIPRFASEARMSTPTQHYVSKPEMSNLSRPHVITAAVVFGPGGSQSVNVAFEGLPSEASPWKAKLRHSPTLHFTHVCTAYAFEKRILPYGGDPLAWGDLTSRSSSESLEVAAEQLRLGSFAVMYHAEDFSILVYAAKCDKWKALAPKYQGSGLASAALRYMIFRAGKAGQFLPPASYTPARNQGPASGDFALQVFGLDHIQLLSTEMRKGQGRHNYFLAIHPSRGTILDMVCTWVRSVDPQANVFLSDAPGDWKAFLDIVRKGCGIFIIHEKALPTIRFFAGIRTLLEAETSKVSFWRFQEKLQRAMIKPSDQHPVEGYVPFGLSRLFPDGDAVLLTPSFLVAQPQRAQQLLSWYKNRTKRFAAHVQLVCSSGTTKFLGAVAVEKMQERQRLQRNDPGRNFGDLGLAERDCDARLVIWDIISELSCAKEVDGPTLVFADETIHPADEQSLANWFAYWSGSNLHQYRNFRVLCSDDRAPPATTMIDTPLFARGTFAVPDSSMAAPPMETTCSQSDILRIDSAFQVLPYKFYSYFSQPAFNNLPFIMVYRYPISYCQSPDERTHYGDETPRNTMNFHSTRDWLVEWMWDISRLQHNPKKHTATQMCFCLTIPDEWDPAKYDRGVFPPRHPWIGVLRPTRPKWKPYKSLELLIWDVNASVKFPRDTEVLESQLLPAQQAFIQTVREEAPARHQLPLEKVWLSGRHLSSADGMSTIDHTLKMMGQMIEQSEQWLPMTVHQLEEAGFKMVHPGPSGPVYTVFHAPSRPVPSSSPSKCRNLLFQKAQTGEPRISCDFGPTKQWYDIQREEGRHYEHIQFESWESIFGAVGVTLRDSGN